MSLYVNGASFAASFRAPFTASGLKKPSGAVATSFLVLAGGGYLLLADAASHLKLAS